MADIYVDILLLICADTLLRASSVVCKRWRQVLLLDRMAEIRAQLPDLSMKEIIDLPALFYNDLTITQQILLPNELFNTIKVYDDIRNYDSFKFKIPWNNVQESEYVKNMLYEHIRRTVTVHPRNSFVYFQYMFRRYIQYVHYMVMISNNGAIYAVIEGVMRDMVGHSCRRFILKCVLKCVWEFNEKHAPRLWLN